MKNGYLFALILSITLLVGYKYNQDRVDTLEKQLKELRAAKSKTGDAINRACPAFPDFQNVSGIPNKIQGEPGYSNRPKEVKRRPSLHFGPPSSVSGHGKAGASARLFTKPILSGPFEYDFVGEQS